MPVWHERTREWVKEGRLALLGVTQEQHADRCCLFARSKAFDWPILHDPINVLESPAVPIVVAIDEHGIVRVVGPKPETFARDFLDRAFADDAPPTPKSPGPADPDILLTKAREMPGAGAWREAGDALALWGGPARVDEAIDAYRRAGSLDPSDKHARFRLGVAHRMRYESAGRHPGDFAAAVGAWAAALDLDPNQYIWRRRIEQYGPRLAKPYPFYDWVEGARTAIAARGEGPVPLAEEPSGSEVAGPVREVAAALATPAEPDPTGRIHRDARRLAEAEVVVVPPRVRPGGAARVHVTFRPGAGGAAHWNNESTPLRLWVSAPDGWATDARLLEARPGDGAESDEPRHLDFELKAPADARGKVRLPAYALYNVCEQSGGQCLFLRQDLTIEVEVAGEARPE